MAIHNIITRTDVNEQRTVISQHSTRAVWADTQAKRSSSSSLSTAIATFSSSGGHLGDSLTHWSTWPAVRRSALYLQQSPAMSHVRSAQCPRYDSICVVQEWRGRPCEHLQCAGWRPDLTFTARLSVVCAGSSSVSQRTWCRSGYTGCLDLSGWWQSIAGKMISSTLGNCRDESCSSCTSFTETSGPKWTMFVKTQSVIGVIQSFSFGEIWLDTVARCIKHPIKSVYRYTRVKDD